MREDRIFVVHGEELLEVTARPYDKEDQLQTWLERHPQLIGQLHGDRERRLLLVRREAGVPGAEDTADRWSLDHLFIDEDAWPVFVEVKRASDTRIRREVIAQMFDYVANATAYWTQEAMPDWFTDTCQQSARDPVQSLATHLGLQVDDPNLESVAQEFWGRAWANLRAGRLFMVFVADSIPRELRRVVEFLNERMTPTEVVAIEVQRYIDLSAGSAVEALVPRLIGRTAVAEGRKGAGAQPSVLMEQASAATAEIKRRLDEWAARSGLGAARERGTSFQYRAVGKTVVILYPRWETVHLWLHPLYGSGQASDAHSLVKAFRKLNTNAGEKEPSVPCSVLLQDWQYFESDILTPLLEAHTRRAAL